MGGVSKTVGRSPWSEGPRTRFSVTRRTVSSTCLRGDHSFTLQGTTDERRDSTSRRLSDSSFLFPTRGRDDRTVHLFPVRQAHSDPTRCRDGVNSLNPLVPPGEPSEVLGVKKEGRHESVWVDVYVLRPLPVRPVFSPDSHRGDTGRSRSTKTHSVQGGPGVKGVDILLLG